MKKAIRLIKLMDLLQHPGKTKTYLSNLFKVDERTIERDLIDLKTIGFDNDKDQAGRHFIFPNLKNRTKIYLSNVEADFISDLMRQTHPNHALTQSIQTKLLFRSGGGHWLSSEVRKKLPKIINQLNDAMSMHCQIEVEKYFSAYQGTKIYRKLQPLFYTTNYRYLIAYEEKDDLFVNVKIDRLSTVRILEEKCTKSPDATTVDIFQMAFNKKRYVVELLLSSLAYRILIEERPGIEDYIIPFEDGKYTHKFSATTATLLPLARFCMGLAGQVKVVKGDDLLVLLKERKAEILW